MSGAPLILPLREAETFSKPGTADVTAGDRKKLSGLLAHYKSKPHPFSACKRDQMKHGLSADHANRRCAVLKDLMEGTTKWRGKAKEEAEDIVAEALVVVTVANEELGRPVVERLVEMDAGVVAEAAKLLEVASWMIPAAAKRPGFKPYSPEAKSKSKSSTSKSDFEKKHPRGSGEQGGQFIRKGSSSPAVSKIQKRLGIATTGTFGGNTIQAVKAFQRKHNLQVDGVVGQQTAAALLGLSSRKPGALTSGLRKQLGSLGASGGSSASRPRPSLGGGTRKVGSSRRRTRGGYGGVVVEEDQLEERTVHVETVEDEPGVKRVMVSKIRSSLYDLSEPNNPTHTVQLPKGTKITVKPGMVGRTYSSYSRTFIITSADGETVREVTGSDEAAEVAKEVDAGIVSSSRSS